MLKGGILGFGGVGQSMTSYINQGDRARITAACDLSAEALDSARGRFGLAATDDPAELVGMDLDFVVVSSTNNAHKDHVVLAARAGKHVFCEKPIALSLEEADAMIEAVETAGVANVVNYSSRYVPAFIKVKEIADEGTLGDILSLWAHRGRGFGLYGSGARHKAIVHPELSGGWTVHHTCHAIDLLVWLAGPAKTAYAGTRSTAPEGASEEVVMGLLQFTGGAIGSVFDTVGRLREQYLGIVGTRGSLMLHGEGENTVLRVFREGSAKDEPVSTVSRKRRGGGFDLFLECIHHGKPSPMPIRDAKPSLAIALALQQSARTGQVVPVAS